MSTAFARGALLLLSSLPAAGAQDDAEPTRPAFVWDARAARHLYERAGFGATPEELRSALEQGPAAVIDDWLGREDRWVDIVPELFRWEMFGLDHMQLPLEDAEYYELDRAVQVERCKSARHIDREQFLELYRQYFASIVEHRDPLRDRMTLFWHGLFTTSIDVNKRKFELIHQFQWLRREALGSYADLLHGVVRDPAMLQYLDNTSSSRQQPNENLARELMELFSLGEGNYTERDVKEAARALTGHAGSAEGTYEFLPEHHDDGVKTILGVTGPHDADDLVAILLDRPECGRWIARRLLRHFEGLEPDDARLEAYAELLRGSRYELRPFLRRLFLDPEFYRDEVVGRRVRGPLEYMASLCRKLELQPAPGFLMVALKHLGQALYHPPSVKGWPEGLDWMSTDALLLRANCAGVLIGHDDPGFLGAPGTRTHEHYAALIRLRAGPGWLPGEALTAQARALAAQGDRALAAWLTEAWLGIPAAPRALALLTRFLELERGGAPTAGWLADEAAARELLRRAAHFLFSLPEAQLG